MPSELVGMESAPCDNRLRGLTFSRQLPNAADAVRGVFVVEQMFATAPGVDWEAIAPVAWPLRRRGVRIPHDGDIAGFRAAWPRYPVMPRRILFTHVGAAMARASQSAFDAAIIRSRPQFVHAHELYPSGLAAAELADRAGLPLVVTVHGSDLYSNLIRPEWSALLERVAMRAAVVVCVSASLARDLIAATGIDRAHVRVIPDVYDDDRFRYIPRAVHGRVTRMLSIGRLVDVKGYDILFAAMGALRRSGGPDVVLRLVGEGPRETRLRSLARAEGIAEQVEFVGNLTREQLAQEMAAADLYVQPSRKEGFGLALVEAMATGLPVLATASGGPADIVRAGEGVLVAPNDSEALTGGLRDALERLESFDPRLIASGVRRRFGRRAVGPQLVALYSEVVEAHSTHQSGVS